ncbi:MAG TPA: VWA domain-containing protein [Vicinamibacterales bacterium]|nr:VWA domain-containing protein [Vicinamibacterales bacterium]
MRYRIMLLGLVLPALLVAQQAEMPRFRAGANLVRVDAYVSKDDVAVTDLKAEDFTVYEDDKPQKVENFELITARRPNPQSERTDPTNTRDMQQQVADAARVFTLFFDRFHVQLSGSYHARKPIIDTLDRVIGPDDLIGVMTPEMSASSVTYSRRTGSIERAVTDTWFWGEKGRVSPSSNPEERAIEMCYPQHPDIVAAMIARMREKRTLDSLRELVLHLDVLRPERKFVIVFTEGWPLYRPNQELARVLDKRIPTGDPVGVDPRTGGLRRPGSTDPSTGGNQSVEACDRQRTMMAYIDHEVEFRELLQLANRANVSFYPIDARGLVVFDTPIEWGVPAGVDAAWLRNRYNNLRDMASQTDGATVLDTNDISGAMQKVFKDVGSYYLMSYYSTNQKLDGRFRRIRVEVKRPDVDVRARPGYLAPTESEARTAGVSITRAGERPAPPPTVTRALDALAPARGNLPVRVQAVGARGTIRAVVELDSATVKLPEWLAGGTLRLTFEPERTTGTNHLGQSQTLTMAIEPGQRSIFIPHSEQPLAAGRYAVRAELTARNARQPIQVTTFATVPADAIEVGTGGLASRRGPSTGLAYVVTADPRFRRTERLRIEVPLAGEGFAGTGRLLTREGQATPLIVSFSERTDEATKQQLGVADVTLAPLAEGEYVLELSLVKGGKTDVITYGFRLIP